jgi:hypothetical protein
VEIAPAGNFDSKGKVHDLMPLYYSRLFPTTDMFRCAATARPITPCCTAPRRAAWETTRTNPPGVYAMYCDAPNSLGNTAYGPGRSPALLVRFARFELFVPGTRRRCRKQLPAAARRALHGLE